MPSIDDVYRGFGYAAEAVQLLETELGTLLFKIRCEDLGLLGGDRGIEAPAILDKINRSTLDEGRAVMVADLAMIHAVIFAAYNLVMTVGGSDLDALDLDSITLPTKHLKLD